MIGKVEMKRLDLSKLEKKFTGDVEIDAAPKQEGRIEEGAVRRKWRVTEYGDKVD